MRSCLKGWFNTGFQAQYKTTSYSLIPVQMRHSLPKTVCLSLRLCAEMEELTVYFVQKVVPYLAR